MPQREGGGQKTWNLRSLCGIAAAAVAEFPFEFCRGFIEMSFTVDIIFRENSKAKMFSP